MDTQNLVRMANRIGTFFEAMPDREQALADIAGHLKKFWEPRMRAQMLTHIDEHKGDGLSDIVMLSLARYRSQLEDGL